MPTPEEQAREHIDQALEQAGWRVQDYKSANLHAGRGVVLRNFPLVSGHGFADYRGGFRSVWQDRQDQGGPMPIVTAFVLSMLFLALTGCAASSPSAAATQETGKKQSPVKPDKHDEEKAMNEESQNAVGGR